MCHSPDHNNAFDNVSKYICKDILFTVVGAIYPHMVAVFPFRSQMPAAI